MPDMITLLRRNRFDNERKEIIVRYITVGMLVLVIALFFSGQNQEGMAQALRQNQKESAKKTDSNEASQELDALRQRIFQTLLNLRSEAAQIEPIPDQVRTLLEVADSLWLIDPEQAKDVFIHSYERAANYDESYGSKTSKTDKITSASLRQMVITRVARRDVSLANSLITRRSANMQERKSKEPDIGTYEELYGGGSSHNEPLIVAARELLPIDTKKAAQIAAHATSEDFSQGLRLFLLELRLKDSQAADALFEAIFKVASTRQPKKLVDALFLWDYAFQRSEIYLGSVSWSREPAEKRSPVISNVKARTLSFAIGAVLENAKLFSLTSVSDADKPIVLERYALLHSVATQILPDVRVYMPLMEPALHTELRRLEQELLNNGRTPPKLPDPPSHYSDTQNSVDKLIEQASKATNIKLRDGLYARAVFRLYLHGEWEQALSLAQKIENLSLRLKLTEPIKFDQAGFMISQDNLNGAQSIAYSIETLELRAAILAKIGDTYLNSKKQEQALEMLNNAGLIAETARPTIFLGSVILGIASRVLEHDRDRGIELISAAIRKINGIDEGELWALIQTANGLSGRLSTQNRSWSARKDGSLTSVTIAYPRFIGLVDMFSKISKTDLDGAMLLVQQLKWVSLRCSTQAIIARQAIEQINNLPLEPPVVKTRKESKQQ